MNAPHPFLRWAGGKRQLLPTLQAIFPSDFDLSKNRYFEPFLGGGAVMFDLKSHPSATKIPATKSRLPIVVNDVNIELMTTYKVLKNNCPALISELIKMSKNISEKEFYRVRASKPKTDIKIASRMIYLNRLAFNGLYRVNNAGLFNVPYGKLLNPTVCDRENMSAVSQWLQYVELRCGSYVSCLIDAKKGDLVYLDPPYIPLTTTANFSKYTKDNFLELDQWGLSGVIKGLTDRGVRVILSNSNTDLTKQIFKNNLKLYFVPARRSIGASAKTRVRIKEVLGINYPINTCSQPKLVKKLILP
jgi:DNA adenine methylase